MQRNSVQPARSVTSPPPTKTGAWTCVLFTALLGCAFLAGAAWAAMPWAQ